MRLSALLGPALALVSLPSLAAPATPQDVTTLFSQWREFQRPPRVDGVPDYSPTAMKAQAKALPGWLKRVNALDVSGAPLPLRNDVRIIRAEMNGLDFNHRVLSPCTASSGRRTGPSSPCSRDSWESVPRVSEGVRRRSRRQRAAVGVRGSIAAPMRTIGLILLVGCATVPPVPTGEDARRSLLAAHAVEREAHLARNPDPIAAMTAEGFLMLDRGEIRTISAAEMRTGSSSTSGASPSIGGTTSSPLRRRSRPTGPGARWPCARR